MDNLSPPKMLYALSVSLTGVKVNSSKIENRKITLTEIFRSQDVAVVVYPLP